VGRRAGWVRRGWHIGLITASSVASCIDVCSNNVVKICSGGLGAAYTSD
jgi:hypothetical protein